MSAWKKPTRRRPAVPPLTNDVVPEDIDPDARERRRIWLRDFVAESNRIEGILIVREQDIRAHEELLRVPKGQMTVGALEQFVASIAPGAKLRRVPGMDVMINTTPVVRPMPGGAKVEEALVAILSSVNHLGVIRSLYSPHYAHRKYEQLHPFMDGNGRSGRALWLWMQGGVVPGNRLFLQEWYYQSLRP